MDGDDVPQTDLAIVRRRSREARQRAEDLRSDAADAVARARETTARVRDAVGEAQSTFGVRSARSRRPKTSGPTTPESSA